MLANGAKLEFKSKTVTTYTKLKGLKEIPEIGVDPSALSIGIASAGIIHPVCLYLGFTSGDIP